MTVISFLQPLLPPNSPERVEVRTEAGKSGWVTRSFVQLHSGGGGRAGADGAVVRSGRQLSSAHIFTLVAGERFY